MSYPALDIVYSIELLYKGAEAGRRGIKVTGAAHAVILMRKMIVIMRRDLTQLFLSNYTESLTRGGTPLLIYSVPPYREQDQLLPRIIITRGECLKTCCKIADCLRRQCCATLDKLFSICSCQGSFVGGWGCFTASRSYIFIFTWCICSDVFPMRRDSSLETVWKVSSPLYCWSCLDNSPSASAGPPSPPGDWAAWSPGGRRREPPGAQGENLQGCPSRLDGQEGGLG